jgi:hypothetical protein
MEEEAALRAELGGDGGGGPTYTVRAADADARAPERVRLHAGRAAAAPAALLQQEYSGTRGAINRGKPRPIPSPAGRLALFTLLQVDDAIERCGNFGRFQWFILFFAGLSWVCDAFEARARARGGARGAAAGGAGGRRWGAGCRRRPPAPPPSLALPPAPRPPDQSPVARPSRRPWLIPVRSCSCLTLGPP